MPVYPTAQAALQAAARVLPASDRRALLVEDGATVAPLPAADPPLHP